MKSNILGSFSVFYLVLSYWSKSSFSVCLRFFLVQYFYCLFSFFQCFVILLFILLVSDRESKWVGFVKDFVGD